MKLIKFRVRNVRDKCWDNPSILEVWDDSGKLEPLYGPRENYPIQQFIGIKDKNNKEIYECDLINFRILGHVHGPDYEDIKNAEVWYSEEDLQFVFGKYKMNDGKEWWYSMADRIDKTTIEVVGNIYEKQTGI